MELIDTAKFKGPLKLAKEAKKLRDQAKEAEDKAVESFRQVRAEMLEPLQDEKKRLEKELETLRTEYFELASTFCEQSGRHTSTYRTVRTGNIPLYHSFSRGNVYPTETYSTCLICGASNDPERFRDRRSHNQRCYKEGSEDVIQKASEQTENLELKKTALRILEIPEQFNSLSDKINEINKALEELCSLFGHDADITSYDRENFKCKCCGKKMGYREYINAHYAAKYRGGIIPFHYEDNRPIL